jgi:molybdopterin-biosynthesis enzyme MoeA-like protein
MPNMVTWKISPPHAVRFVSFQDGSIVVEFLEGREEEVAEYLHKWIDAHKQITVQIAANKAEEAKNKASLAVTVDANCAACQWAREHPRTRCEIHNPTPATP